MARDKKDGTTKGSGVVRCAIYTRKSTEEGLDQDFNSLDAQREAGEAYIRSQASEGWTLVPSLYDDGGYTGANIERPGMKRLLEDIQAKKVDCVVVYKVDRLSRSIRDFAKIMETFEKHGAQFVSVTKQFNTTTSADPEHPPVFRPIRTRDHFRAHAGQAGCRAQEGEVDGRVACAGLQLGGQPSDH